MQLFHIMLYRLLFFPTGLFIIDMLPDHDIRNLLVSSEGLTQTQQRRQTLFKTQLAVILSLMYTISIENRTRQFFCMSYHIRKHKFLQGSSRFKFKVKLTKHTRVLWTPFLITKIMEQFRLPQWWHLDSLPPCSF